MHHGGGVSCVRVGLVEMVDWGMPQRGMWEKGGEGSEGGKLDLGN